MKTRTVYFLMLFLAAFNLHAYEFSASKHQAKCVERKGMTDCKLSASGIVNFSQTSNPRQVKNIIFKLNDHVNGVLKLYHSRGHKADEIKGFFIVDNKQAANSNIKYKVIFKDRKGAVAQSAGQLHLSQGNNQRKKFGSVDLTAHDLKNIDSYEIQMVETTTTRKQR